MSPRSPDCSTDIGIDVNVCAPLGATPADIARLGDADFNVVLYPEIAGPTAQWLQKTFKQPFTKTIPIGVRGHPRVHRRIGELSGIDVSGLLAVRAIPPALVFALGRFDLPHRQARLHLRRCDACDGRRPCRVRRAWPSPSPGSAPIRANSHARSARSQTEFGVEALITDDYLEVEARIAQLQPELVLGTQMERHIAKRLGIPCAVISAPVHVQDFPARYSPQMGFEGANVIFDTWVHPLMMGLEEHLLAMFRDDHEFHDDAGASHLGHQAAQDAAAPIAPEADAAGAPILWTPDAEKELKKIPFFVRGKARRNTESFAQTNGLAQITLETLYDAKAHFGR